MINWPDFPIEKITMRTIERKKLSLTILRKKNKKNTMYMLLTFVKASIISFIWVPKNAIVNSPLCSLEKGKKKG